jgi:hypothetical protein
MKSKDLTVQQVERLVNAFARQRDYLNRLRARMNEQGFPTDDALYRSVSDVADRSSNLVVVASSLRNRARGSRDEREPTIMERHPWGGDPR